MEHTFKTEIATTLEKPTESLANDRGLNLLRINIRGTAASPVIEVLLDGERAVSLDDCETVSRELSSLIDTKSLVKGNYRLDVMSPGIDEPLEKDWQFQRNLGRLVEVQYRDGGDHHTIHGHLRNYTIEDIGIEPIHTKSNKPKKKVTTEDGESVTLERDEQLYDTDVELVRIERKHVLKAVVQPDFR